MFKSGDDLRQDSFVLQMVEVMNRIWLLSGQDYRIITFNVVTTGDRQGIYPIYVYFLLGIGNIAIFTFVGS